jgi:hypothetical protein
MPMLPNTIVGYTYQSTRACPECTIEEFVQDGSLSPAARDMSAEDALDQAWEAQALFDTPEGALRADESTFDSDDFPHVIRAWQTHLQEICEVCGTRRLFLDFGRDMSEEDED